MGIKADEGETIQRNHTAVETRQRSCPGASEAPDMICFRAVDAAQADTLRAGVVQALDDLSPSRTETTGPEKSPAYDSDTVHHKMVRHVIIRIGRRCT